MNNAHLHLLVNHVSLFAVFFGGAALAVAIFRKSPELKWSALGLFLLAGVFVWIASLTGEGAEELVEHLPGVEESLIHAHEEAGEWAQVATTILAALSAGFFFLVRARPRWAQKALWALLVVALWTSAVLARTAYLGGSIRHTEIRPGASTAASMDQD